MATLWQDNFQRADGVVGNDWNAQNGATAQIVDGALRRTDYGQYRILHNAAGGVLPADYYLTATVPHTLVTSSGVYWGFMGRYAAGVGVKVMWQNDGPQVLGAGHADYTNDIAVTVTGGFPESWTVDQDHMVTLQFAGTTVTIYLDGEEYGYFTDATNNQAGTGVAIVGDAGTGGLYRVYDVDVTDDMPVFVASAATAMSATASNSVVVGSTGNSIVLAGINTGWVAGTPGTPAFTVSAGTITAQVIHSATSATLTFTAPATAGAVTVTDTLNNVTATVVVVAAAVDGTYWEDDFDRANGDVGNGWTAQNGATAQIVDGALRRTDYGQYRILHNAAGGVLPADYYLTATVPHTLVTSSGVYWGFMGRYAAGEGVKVMWQNDGPQVLGAGHADYTNDIAVTVTGGFPESWTVDQDHMVTLQFAGTTVTLYLDGEEYGYFTDATNNQAGAGVAIVGDAGTGGRFNVLSVAVTDELPTLDSTLPVMMSAAAGAVVLAGSTGNSIVLTGTNTAWAAGTPGTPTFAVSVGTVTAQVVSSATSATLTFNAPAAAGVVTVTDPVNNVTATFVVIAEAVDGTYWEDDFERADGDVGNGWATQNGATAQIVGGALRRTDYGQYRILHNAAGGVLPADYYLTATIPHTLVTSSGVYWGFMGRYADGAGVKVMWQNDGPQVVGAGHADYTNDIAVTVTGGFPESWTVDQDHRVTLQFEGTTVTLYLDGEEYGYFTDATNNRAGAGVAIVGDAGTGGRFNVLSVAVTDELPAIEAPALPVTMTATAGTVVSAGSAGNSIVLTGVNSAWQPGTPGTPTFTVSAGTVTAQVVNSTTSATLTFTAPATAGVVTVTDPVNNVTATFVVSAEAVNGVYWEDDFERTNGDVGNGWTTTGSATAQIIDGALRRTDTGSYGILHNAVGGTLPADYYLTATVPHSLVTSSGVYWGFIGRYAAGAGVKVLWQNSGPLVMGAGHAAYTNDIAITVTGGFPASWSVEQNHTVALRFAGTTVTIYLDGQAYGYFTDATNNQAGTGVGIVGDAGTAGLFNVLDVAVTNYLVVPSTTGASVALSVTVSVTGLNDNAVTVHSVSSGGTAPYSLQWHRSATSGFTPSTETTLVGATTPDYTNMGLTTGTTYYYRAVVTDSDGTIAVSAELPAVPVDAALAVGYLSHASLNVDVVVLACAGTTGGTAPLQYQWHRTTTYNQTPSWDGATAIASSNSLTLTDVPPVPGRVYSYVMLVRDNEGTVAASTPILALSYLSRLRLGVLGDVCLSNHSDPLGREIPDWLELYLRSAWGPRDVMIVDQSTGDGASARWAPGSDAYNIAVAAFDAAGVTHVFLQYSWDGDPAATALTVNQLVADGFVVLLGHHQFTTQSPTGTWRQLADGIYSDGPAIAALANGTTIIACDLTSIRSGVAFGRHTTDPEVVGATSYLDAVDLHPSAFGIPLLAGGMAASIAQALAWAPPDIP